ALTAMCLTAACGRESPQRNAGASPGSAASSTTTEAPGTSGVELDTTPPASAPSTTDSGDASYLPSSASGQPSRNEPGMQPAPAATPGTEPMDRGGPDADATNPDAPSPSTDSTQTPPASGPPQPSPTAGAPTDGETPGSAEPEPESTRPDVHALFDMYWDFADVVDEMVLPLVGDEPLQLFGASVAVDGGGIQLTGADSSAASVASSIDTSGDVTISAWVRFDALAGFNTFVSVEGKQV